jgi:hypothetical protein
VQKSSKMIFECRRGDAQMISGHPSVGSMIEETVRRMFPW